MGQFTVAPQTLRTLGARPGLAPEMLAPFDEANPPQRTRGQEMAGAAFENVIDAFLGSLGIAPTGETKANLVGQLVSAAIPVVGGAKTLEDLGRLRVSNPIKAYHGSPHDFDQFSLSKIGTGEGAQVRGHGLYFGEASDTGRSYRDSVGAAHAGGARTYDPDIRIGGTRIEDVYSAIERKAVRMPHQQAEHEFNKLALLEDLAHDGDVLAIEERAKLGSYSPEVLDWFKKEVLPKFERKGRLYEVNIHANPEDFLDWDKPLSQQSEKVRQRFPGITIEKNPEPAFGDERWTVSMGDRVMDAFPTRKEAQRVINETPIGKLLPNGEWSRSQGGKEVSADLLQRGIPGVKYLDGGSRAAGEGSRNYVVFDDKLIEIVKKYGIAATLGAGLINESQARQLRAQGQE